MGLLEAPRSAKHPLAGLLQKQVAPRGGQDMASLEMGTPIHVPNCIHTSAGNTHQKAAAHLGATGPSCSRSGGAASAQGHRARPSCPTLWAAHSWLAHLRQACCLCGWLPRHSLAGTLLLILVGPAERPGPGQIVTTPKPDMAGLRHSVCPVTFSVRLFFSGLRTLLPL